MDFTVTTLGPCRKKVAVKVPPSRIREEYDKQYGEINDNFALPGFRKGHAPRKLLEKKFGTKLGDEVKEHLVRAALEKLSEEKKVDAISPPEIAVDQIPLDPAKDFEFEFEVVTKPDFATPKWKGLEVKVPHPTVSDEEMQSAVDGLRRRRAKLSPAEDAPVEDGDVLVIDWVARSGDSVDARDDGVFYPFGRGVLSGFVVEGLDEQLKGKKAGATAKAEVQVAVDDPREELRGKKLQLEATLKQVQRYVLPPIDADFLKSLDFDDEKEMREDVKKRILRSKQREVERLAEERLVERLLGEVQISLPDGFVEKELEAWAARRRVAGQMEGTAEEEIAKQIEAARGDAKATIEKDLRRYFLLDRIAEEEKLEVTEAEMVGAIEEIAAAYGRPPDEVLQSFREPGRLAELRSQIRHRKAREALRQGATVVEEAPAAAAPAATAKSEKKSEKHEKHEKSEKSEAPKKSKKK